MDANASRIKVSSCASTIKLLLAPPFSLRKESSIFTISCKFLQGPSGPGPNFSSARSRTSCKQLGMGLEPKTCFNARKAGCFRRKPK